MKARQSSIIITAVLIMAICITGCKKKTTAIDAEGPSMAASINGAPFSVTDPLNITASTSSSGSLSYTYVYGTDAAGRVIELAIANGYTVNVAIPLATGGSAAYYYSSGLSGSYTYATSGTILITSTIQPSIAGTFSFVCADSTTVTNGSFVVTAP